MLNSKEFCLFYGVSNFIKIVVKFSSFAHFFAMLELKNEWKAMRLSHKSNGMEIIRQTNGDVHDREMEFRFYHSAIDGNLNANIIEMK